MNAPLAAALGDRYRLERELGQGGMATVYLAEDLKHGRHVAIKVLRPELAAVLGAERFVSEVRTTANLQHPHILPLHDSGEADGFLFYVMPYVEGESLRDRLRRERQLPVAEAVRIATEVASALDYAHRRGVIHRDIKPENILLHDGRALVADFGIALAVATPDDHRVTTVGVSVGSPAYMSPEQATAVREIDRRSDIYSLAVVLYEMLVGDPPFLGTSVQAITARKLSQPVPSMRSVRESVPEPVEAAVARALARVPADRFPSCAEFIASLEASPAAAARGPVPSGRRLSRWLPLVAGAAAAAGAAAVVFRQSPAAVQIGRRWAVAATSSLELLPALSPDGKLVAFTMVDGTTTRLIVQQVDGGLPITIAAQLDNARDGTFSPDGDRIMLAAAGGLYIVPTLGGQARLVVPRRENGLLSGTWSPDGSRIAYVQDDTLFVQRIDSARVPLAHGAQLHSPAWSPDGKWIAYVSGNRDNYTGNVAPSALHLAPATGGSDRVLTDSSALNTSPVWLPGARALLFISNRDGGRDVYQLRLHRSGAPAGVPVRITTGLDAGRIRISADGRRLAWSVFTFSRNIWSLPIPARDSLPVSAARQVTDGRQLIENLSVSPDGRWLVYDSDRSGNQDLWRTPLAGGPPEQITNDPADDFQPAVSPDGREVAFHSMRTGNRDIFVAPIMGGMATQVSSGPTEDADVAWSPDGRALIWESMESDSSAWIARRGEDGSWSVPARMPIGVARSLAWSPDGRWISYFDKVGTKLWNPSSGERRTLADGVYMQFYDWAEDGRALLGVAIEEGRWRLIRLTLEGRHRTLVYGEGSSDDFRSGFSARRGRMYFTLGHPESDIWLGELRYP